MRRSQVFAAVLAAVCRLDADISFESFGGQIIVPARLDGRGPARFVVDTGSSENYLWSDKAAELKLNGTARETRTDASGTGYAITVIENVTIEAGASKVGNQRFASPNRRLAHADGLLGHGFLSPFVIELDFESHRLKLWSAACERAARQTVAIPIEFQEDGRLPTVAAILTMPTGDVVAARMVIDTGAGDFAILNAPFVARHELLARAAKTVDGTSGGLGGRGSPLRYARAKALRLGPYSLAEPIVALATREGGFGARHPWDGILGTGLLSRFAVTIDYPRARLLLEPNASFGERFEFDMSGVFLRENGGQVVVGAVRPGGAAALAGLETGDIIAAIAGEPAPPTIASVRRLFRIDGKSYVLSVLRGSERKQLTIAIRRLL